MKYKLIVLDLDGTLTNSKKEITPPQQGNSNTYTRARNTTRISFRTTYLWYCTISQRITDE